MMQNSTPDDHETLKGNKDVSDNPTANDASNNPTTNDQEDTGQGSPVTSDHPRGQDSPPEPVKPVKP